MIQFNLLPDIKLEYIKAKRSKRTVVLISMAVASVSIGLFVLLFLTVNVFQKQHLNNLSTDITRYSGDLKSVEGLDRILTVQNQLNSLTGVHDQKAVLSRLKDYITQITPAQVSYASIDLDVELSTIKFAGSADSLKTINQFVDTLKFTKYSTQASSEQLSAFSNVVLTGFDTDEEKGFTYEIDLMYDPAIFSSNSVTTLSVPTIVTTRSAIERPTENILQAVPSLEGGNQ